MRRSRAWRQRWRRHFDVAEREKVYDKTWWKGQAEWRLLFVHANTITVTNVRKEMTPRRLKVSHLPSGTIITPSVSVMPSSKEERTETKVM
jgi:hypothetical protein